MSTKKVEEMILAVCRKHPEGVQDTVLEQELPNVSVNDRALAINALLSALKLQILVNPADPSSHIYKASAAADTARLKGLTPEDMLVYQCIQGAGNMGIWTRDMKTRTNLQQPKINKILKTLEERLLVKSVKSVQNASKKVYMLYELEPAKELTGGPWYGPDAFDSEFITVLQDATMSYIKSKGDATLADIVRFIKETVSAGCTQTWYGRHECAAAGVHRVREHGTTSVQRKLVPSACMSARMHACPAILYSASGSQGISKQALQEDDVQRIINTLDYDGKIEGVDLDDDGVEHYRLALMKIPETTAFTSIPCGVCPVFNECVEGGKISPATCVYYQEWLDF
ncbi:hypothetical protein ABPG75_009800 [Micractinium tetrahymenae]